MEPITHDRLAGISAFVAAAEAGSFAQAAARLGLTRSAIGKAIARLEARVGTRLFVRTTRSLALTETARPSTNAVPRRWKTWMPPSSCWKPGAGKWPAGSA